jgi:hypothetical protein
LLGTSANWDFDLCQLEKLTKSPLRVMTMNCMTKLDLMHKIDFDESKLACFMNEIEKSYPKNPYHNAMHATDIVQATYHFCTVGRLLDATGISHLSTAALIIAAAIHDVNHIGVTNQFLVTTSAHLAIEYNDRSPLENMHLATAFGMMNKQSLNFMERLAPCIQKDIRRLIIAIVLATDNDRHFSLQESLEKVIDQREERNSPINQIITRGNSRLSGTPTSLKNQDLDFSINVTRKASSSANFFTKINKSKSDDALDTVFVRYIYICMYIYVNIDKYKYTYVQYMHIYTYIYIYINLSLMISICIYAYIYINLSLIYVYVSLSLMMH